VQSPEPLCPLIAAYDLMIASRPMRKADAATRELSSLCRANFSLCTELQRVLETVMRRETLPASSGEC